MLDKLAHGERPKYYPYSYFVEEQEKSVKTTARKVSPFKCGACRGTTTVGADGMLYPCHRFVGMEAWRIGTIGNGPDYGRCKKFWRDYRACVAVKCESCWLWAQCKGPCPWEIAQADGSFKFSDRHCEQMEKHIKKAVAFYTRLKAEERKVRMGSK
jgi:uncharacterized protein